MNKTAYLFAIIGILATGLLTAGALISSSSVMAQNFTDAIDNETGAMNTTTAANMTMQDGGGGGNMTTNGTTTGAAASPIGIG